MVGPARQKGEGGLARNAQKRRAGLHGAFATLAHAAARPGSNPPSTSSLLLMQGLQRRESPPTHPIRSDCLLDEKTDGEDLPSGGAERLHVGLVRPGAAQPYDLSSLPTTFEHFPTQIDHSQGSNPSCHPAVNFEMWICWPTAPLCLVSCSSSSRVALIEAAQAARVNARSHRAPDQSA